ncbi:hypothetical protein CFIICLFH_3138 [Methylobacterium goesingense]|nr:hypothetical protein CFIICLFH_3138 [Methylobacterium goesingense]
MKACIGADEVEPGGIDFRERVRRQGALNDAAQAGALPVLCGQYVVGVGQRDRAGIEHRARGLVGPAPEGLRGDGLDRRQGVLHAVVELVRQEALALGRRLLLGDVAYLDDGADDLGTIVADRAGGEADRVEVPVLVNEHFLTPFLVILGEGPVDGAFVQGERPPIRIGVVHDVVERAVPREDFGEAESRQQLRGPVHVDAVLAVIHQEDRHGSVVQDRVQASLGLVQLRAATQRRKGRGGGVIRRDRSTARHEGRILQSPPTRRPGHFIDRQLRAQSMVHGMVPCRGGGPRGPRHPQPLRATARFEPGFHDPSA